MRSRIALLALAVVLGLMMTISTHAFALGPPYVLPAYGYLGPYPRPVYDPYYLPYYRFRLYLYGYPRPPVERLFLPPSAPAAPSAPYGGAIY